MTPSDVAAFNERQDQIRVLLTGDRTDVSTNVFNDQTHAMSMHMDVPQPASIDLPLHRNNATPGPSGVRRPTTSPPRLTAAEKQKGRAVHPRDDPVHTPDIDLEDLRRAQIDADRDFANQLSRRENNDLDGRLAAEMQRRENERQRDAELAKHDRQRQVELEKQAERARERAANLTTQANAHAQTRNHANVNAHFISTNRFEVLRPSVDAAESIPASNDTRGIVNDSERHVSTTATGQGPAHIPERSALARLLKRQELRDHDNAHLSSDSNEPEPSSPDSSDSDATKSERRRRRRLTAKR